MDARREDRLIAAIARVAVALPPHRLALIGIGLALVAWAALALNWSWLPRYADLAVQGLWRTIWVLVV
jgi:polar amino acid transport system permease protein